MTKQELITKWEKELELIDKSINIHKDHLLDKTVLISQKVQVLSFIKDLKNLNEETSKDEKVCITKRELNAIYPFPIKHKRVNK